MCFDCWSKWSTIQIDFERFLILEPVVLKTAVHVHFNIRDYKNVRIREDMLLMSLSRLIHIQKKSEQGNEAQKSSVKLPELKRTITKVKNHQINSTEDGEGAGVRISEHVRIQSVKGVDQRAREQDKGSAAKSSTGCSSQVWFGAPMYDRSQLSLTPVLDEPMPSLTSVVLETHGTHACRQNDYTHIKIKIILKR